MRYDVVVHAPAPADEQGAIERVRAALAGAGLEPVELRLETREHGRALHIETTLEAPSAYHCAAIQAPELFDGLLQVAGIPVDGHGLEVTASRPELEGG